MFNLGGWGLSKMHQDDHRPPGWQPQVFGHMLTRLALEISGVPMTENLIWSQCVGSDLAADPNFKAKGCTGDAHSPICFATAYASSEELATFPTGTEMPASLSSPMLMYSCSERFLLCCWPPIQEAARTWTSRMKGEHCGLTSTVKRKSTKTGQLIETITSFKLFSGWKLDGKKTLALGKSHACPTLHKSTDLESEVKTHFMLAAATTFKRFGFVSSFGKAQNLWTHLVKAAG